MLHARCIYAATHSAVVHKTLRSLCFCAVVSSAPARFLFQFRTTMALIVHKYGGTSMGSVERIKNVAKRV
ncbi:MAG TPA: hypothetical protein VGJ10_03505, partial [Paraburkholderia sp.]